MANIFITADPHFGHYNMLEFTTRLGLPMRRFNTVEQMDDCIIENWNKVIRPNDKVYVLGDIAMKRKYISTIARCNGHKRLVRGNHDIFKTKDYLLFFEEIYAYRKLENFLLSHIPIHPESLKVHLNWFNVHGHLHNNVESDHLGPRYINVSTEMTNYTPVSIEEVRQIAKAREEGLNLAVSKQNSSEIKREPKSEPVQPTASQCGYYFTNNSK